MKAQKESQNMKNDTNRENKEGFAGALARSFIHSQLTPLIAAGSLVLGIASVYFTPKEEEPQISVPMIDIRTSLPGYEAHEVQQKVTEVVERAVWGLEGVEYVYSTSSPHMSLVTVRFKVGEPVEPSLVKVHHKMMEVRNLLPAQSSQPLVKSYSIDDVPFLVLTFQSQRDDFALRTLVAPLGRELSGTPDISRVDIYGGRKQSVRVIVDPARAAAAGVSILDVARALETNHQGAPSGKNWGKDNVISVEAGGLLSSAEDVAKTGVGQRAGTVVRVRDVATVVDGPEERTKLSYVLDHEGRSNAVSLSFAKRKGTNAAELSVDVLKRAERFASTLPPDVKMHVMRNYGASARDKSNELIEHLIIATISVGVLIALTMGVRASMVVSLTIPVTLALTLGIYYFLGYTLNRVTLFALIFSIGILVDDAIVVVENVERHLRENPHLTAVQATLRAVAEVGNPTILATFTVIAAILPMMFVRGLMGPYMKPIPVGASFAMILSLLVAFIVTPWAAVRFLKKHESHEEETTSRMDRIYKRVMESLLGSKKSAMLFGGITVGLLLLSTAFIATKAVKVKMLPFDNKNEFQILLDFPASTSLEKSGALSVELAESLLKHPDVERVQIFAGESAPYSFSGLVKHTFMRMQDYKTDLHVVLKEKDHRKKKSHEIIEELRPRIAEFAGKQNARSKVLEIPPGPPVMATMVAEVYGPDAASREQAAEKVREIFAAEKSVVDLDYSWRPERERRVYSYNVNAGALLGISAADATMASMLTFNETPVISLAESRSPEVKSVDLSLAQSARSGPSPFLGQAMATREAGSAGLDQVFSKPQVKAFESLYRKNLKPVSYVVSELSGSEEAPVYGILSLGPKIPYELQTVDVPWNMDKPVVKWDGEWYITYEVFRDLGLAFAAVLVLIYVLVTGWFKSYSVPLVIMAPIPISLIGILPGHAIFGAFFTATSMIGFIAGAGIIVRNSIILVDFIEHEIEQGRELKDAVIQAGITRFRPMLLTAAAVVVGTAVILFDPIFQGLALSLMFGEVAATLLSRLAVPVLYYWFIGRSRASALNLA